MANVTPEYVAEIIDKFEVSDENKQRWVLGIEGNFPPFHFLHERLYFQIFFHFFSIFPPFICHRHHQFSSVTLLHALKTDLKIRQWCSVHHYEVCLGGVNLQEQSWTDCIAYDYVTLAGSQNEWLLLTPLINQ